MEFLCKRKSQHFILQRKQTQNVRNDNLRLGIIRLVLISKKLAFFSFWHAHLRVSITGYVKFAENFA